MIDITCADGKCPVCGGKMIEEVVEKNRSTDCINGCYCYDEYLTSYDENIWVFSCYVFGKPTDFASDDTTDFQNVMKDYVRSTIEHWKKDERYLMRIMEGQT